MEDKQKTRLERYFLNSRRFMWALSPYSRQKDTYKWLQDNNLRFTVARYGLVAQQLLRNPGMEELLKGLIIPTVKKTFPDDTLNVLRKHWLLGECPSLKEVEKLAINYRGKKSDNWASTWLPFIQINTQFNYVEGWGELAGTWFEEIEPWLREEEIM